VNTGEDTTRLGTYLNEQLEAQGMSQAELVRRSGVSQPTISNTLLYRNTPGYDTLLRIAEVMRLDFWYLCEIAGLVVPPSVKVFSPAINALIHRLNALPPVQREAAAYVLNQVLDGVEAYQEITTNTELQDLAAADKELATDIVTEWQRTRLSSHRRGVKAVAKQNGGV
jgi:transcriptional regulator with XRE-family HTH domain